MRTVVLPGIVAAAAAVAGCGEGASGASADTDESSQGATGGEDSGSHGADESTGDTAGDSEGDEPGAGTSSWTTRRLSLVELGNTYQAILGLVPESLSTAPPDSLGLTYDRLVNSQTISAAHLEAFAAGARQALAMLVQEERLDEVVPECSDEILPPLAIAKRTTVHGSSLAGGPSWAIQPSGDPNALLLQYATEATVSYAHSFPAAGTYQVGLHMQILDGSGQDMALALGGEEVATFDSFSAETVYTTTVVVEDAGPGVLDYAINGTGNFTILLTALTVDGPEDPGAGYGAERQACAEAIVDRLAPLAFRRPLAPEERQRFVDLIPLADGDYGEAFKMVFEAIFANPSFLFLVEVGEPVDDTPGVFVLTPHEQAARLSYALCESPPDAALRAAVAAGEFASATQVAEHVRRLLDSPCGQATVGRFFDQWLWLNRVAEIDRDPNQFAEFDEDVAAGMVAETERFARELVYNDEASLAMLLSADYSWPDPRSAHIYGLSGVSEQTRTMLPPERAGILTHPSVLAATATFDSTSPVRRGIFVLHQVLCQDLPPPPPALMVSPPAPDPNATTRERWEQHSSDPSCSGCHRQLDPIGFAFEDFDAIGRHRSVENDLPIDAAGGAPTIGLEDGSVVGGAALARAVAESPETVSCFARQWLRFSMGRIEVAEDEDGLDVVEAALENGSLKEALVSLTTTATFSRRLEEVQP